MTGQRSSCLGTLLTAALLLAAAPTAGHAAAPESDQPIKVIVNNWTSQLVLANISGQLLEKLGYKVEYVPSHTQMQYTAMANGDMHFQVEVWEGTMAEPFGKQVERGAMLDAGSHDAVTREDWWYPLYVEEVCPGLPDWQALEGLRRPAGDPGDRHQGALPGRPERLGEARQGAGRGARPRYRGGQRRRGVDMLWAAARPRRSRPKSRSSCSTGRPTGSRRAMRAASSTSPTTIPTARPSPAGASTRS